MMTVVQVTKTDLNMFYSSFQNKRRKLLHQRIRTGLVIFQDTINFDRLVPRLKHRKYKCTVKSYLGTG